MIQHMGTTGGTSPAQNGTTSVATYTTIKPCDSGSGPEKGDGQGAKAWAKTDVKNGYIWLLNCKKSAVPWGNQGFMSI